MLNHKTCAVILTLTGAAFSVVPAEVQAATSNTAVPSIPSIPLIVMPKFPPRRAPLAPPVVNDVSRAYEFRTQLLGSPQCQRFAMESDTVFLNGALDDAQKADKLKALGAQAQASDCLAPAAAH